MKAETQQKWLQHDRSSQETVAHADVNMMKDRGVQTLTPSQMEKMLAAQQKVAHYRVCCVCVFVQVYCALVI